VVYLSFWKNSWHGARLTYSQQPLPRGSTCRVSPSTQCPCRPLPPRTAQLRATLPSRLSITTPPRHFEPLPSASSNATLHRPRHRAPSSPVSRAAASPPRATFRAHRRTSPTPWNPVSDRPGASCRAVFTMSVS
jgi:hypothetical protein